MKSLTALRFTVHKAAELANVAHLRTVEWVRLGLILSIGGGRKGVRRRVDFNGIVAIAVVNELRRRGLSRTAISTVSLWICSQKVPGLLSCVRHGRTTLVAAGQRVRLIRPDAVGRAAASGVELAVDLQPIIAAVRERVQGIATLPTTKPHLSAALTVITSATSPPLFTGS